MNALIIYYGLSALTVIIPFGASLILWRKSGKNLLDWVLSALCAGAAVLFAFLVGPWFLLSYYLKFAAIVFFIVALVKSYAGLKKRTIFAAGTKTGSVGINLRAVVILCFASLDFLAIKGMFYKGDAVELSFPLRGGTYGVLQGGNSPISNFFHRQNPSQAFAIDMVKLGLSGRRAQGVCPERLPHFYIYGEQVFSPCNGKVIKAVDGVFDNPPGEVNESAPGGNHVIIACKDAAGGVNVMLTHLANGSVYVKTGEGVLTGQRLALVGNSGYSLEPHLHIHAIKASSPAATTDGEAIPMTFNGRFLTMNGVFAAE